MERFDNQDYDYKSYLIMAESGLRKMDDQPFMMDLTKLMDVNLPEGYEIYEEMGIVYTYYLHFVGEKLYGDVVEMADEWFGLF